MVVPLLKNRAGVACTTTGTTSPITLGSALAAATAINQCSWQTFANAGVTNGQVVRYLILDSNGNWEYGTGTYTSAGTTLTRTVIASAIAGVTGTSLITLSASSQVFIASIGEDIVPFEYSTGKLFLGGTTTDLNLWAFPTVEQIILTVQDQAALTCHYFVNNASAPLIWFNKSRAVTPGSHTTVQTGDQLGALQWAADDGTTYSNTVASVDCYVIDTPAAGDVHAQLLLTTAGPGGESGIYSPSTRIQIDYTGIRLQTAQTFMSRDTATTNAVTPIARLSSTTSGTAAIGIGAGLEFEVECATNTKVGGVINAQTTNVTNATEAMTINGQQMAAGALQDFFGISFLMRSNTANIAYTNGTSAQNWFASTTPSISVEGSTAYEFEGQLYLGMTSTTTAHTVGIGFAGGATLTSIAYVADGFHSTANTTTATSPNSTIVTQAANTVVTAASGTTSATISVVRVRGVVRINAAGTFTPQFTFGSASPGAGNILSNSFFKMRKMGQGTNVVQGPWA